MTVITPVAPRAPVEVSERLYTAADLAELPSGPVLYELDNGRLVSIMPPGDEHGAIEYNIVAALKYEGERKGFGKARSGDVGIVLWRNPDRVVGADSVFIANASLPVRRSREGYLETIPELVVEVSARMTRSHTSSERLRIIWLRGSAWCG